MPVAADLLRLAEEASVYEPLKQGEEVVAMDRYVLSLGTGTYPEANGVNRLRCAGDVEGAVEEIRSRVLDHGGTGLLWRVSSAAEPTDLADRLLDLGAAPAEPPAAVALALVEQPSPRPRMSASRASRRWTTSATYVRLTHEVFGVEEWLPHVLAEIERDGECVLADRRFVRYLAWVDGRPAGAGAATFGDVGAMLGAGSTRVSARGRGAYRALVRARWDDAQERGTPALVTWSGPMSEPILRRLGFFEVGRQRILRDVFASSRPA